MRALVWGAAIVVAALAGCSRQDAATGSNSAAGTAATPVSPSTPGIDADSRAERRAERRERRGERGGEGFSPPTSMSRADYGGRMERRFRRLDKNQDNKLAAGELPGNRGERMLRRLDTSGDGAISQDEWSQGMLARFDKRDANNDGTLTADERGKKGEGRRGGRRNRDGGGAMREADTISDNGDEVDQDL